MGRPTTIAEYFDALSLDRKAAMEKLRDTIRVNLPAGFEERLNYGLPSWVVPHSTYGPGYHVDPSLPLPFLAIASTKGHIGLYHMGIYASPSLMEWFMKAWPNHCKKKLNMGKSCIRIRKVEDTPYALIGDLCQKMTVQEWIALYEKAVKR
jgi:hypothetical protein